MTKIIENAFQYQKDVSFFLRLHRHLPDGFCNDMFNCKYREDGEPINIQNDYVEELQKDQGFRQKEKEVLEAQKKKAKMERINKE